MEKQNLQPQRIFNMQPGANYFEAITFNHESGDLTVVLSDLARKIKEQKEKEAECHTEKHTTILTPQLLEAAKDYKDSPTKMGVLLVCAQHAKALPLTLTATMWVRELVKADVIEAENEVKCINGINRGVAALKLPGKTCYEAAYASNPVLCEEFARRLGTREEGR